jgi:ectoine hydroxylase-related dioxygenase (phytanoyl-CoA dioxygenase family)
MITQKQFNSYWEQGYLILNNLFTEEEINNFYNKLSLHNDKEWSNMLNPDRYEFLIAHSAKKITLFSKMSEKIYYLNECKKTSKLIRNLLKDKRIVSTLEKLYNDKFVGLSTHMIWKKPGTKNANQAWNPHQDNSYGQNPNAKLLTINLFLDEVNIENGAIYNYPGSHKEGLLETNWEKSYADSSKPGKFCEVPSKYFKKDIVAPKGTLYIQHGNLIHGSYGNTTNYTTRGMFSATYITKNENFVKGNEAFRKKIKL